MKKILIVEDNPMNLELLATILGVNDFEVLSADGGKISIEVARTERPDLILMDLQMPGVDGYAALSSLRSDDLTRNIPVIAVTGNAMQHDIDRIESSGFDDYILKPYKIDELISTVREALPG
jgi:two-component system, cell cycle response regulator DivK